MQTQPRANNLSFINDTQKKLLPPDDMKPTSSNFDITLPALLLRNVCGLFDRRHPVWNTPAPGDVSVEADITRLRGCRNYVEHLDTVVLHQADFDDKWNELSEILTRLNKTSGITNLPALIYNARAIEIDEESKDRLDKTMKLWDAIDQDVIETVKQGFSTLQHDVKQGLSTVQHEVKKGLTSVTQEVTTVQQRLTTVQQEVQQGLTAVQEDVQQGLTTVQQEVKQGLSSVQQGLTTVQEDIVKLKSFSTEDAKVDGETHRELTLGDVMDYMTEYLTSIPTVNITYKDAATLHFETGSCH